MNVFPKDCLFKYKKKADDKCRLKFGAERVKKNIPKISLKTCQKHMNCVLMPYSSSEATDQPAIKHNLIRVFAARLMNTVKYIDYQRLQLDNVDAQNMVLHIFVVMLTQACQYFLIIIIIIIIDLIYRG